jgi:hypothetical protein
MKTVAMPAKKAVVLTLDYTRVHRGHQFVAQAARGGVHHDRRHKKPRTANQRQV